MSIHSAGLRIRYDNLSFLFGLKLIKDPLIICSKRSKGKYIGHGKCIFFLLSNKHWKSGSPRARHNQSEKRRHVAK